MPAIAQQRFHALDATRAAALLLGVVLHATMSFFLPIPARDVSQTPVLAVVFHVIHTFRMPLFFLIAGFFAHQLLQRRGLRGFAKDRAMRIAVPMTVGWLVLAPVTIAILVVGLSRTFPAATPTGADTIGAQGVPLTHLWFLYYLCIFYVLAGVLHSLCVTWLDRDGTLGARIGAVLRHAIASGLAPFALAAPLFAVLYFDASWPAWFGVPTPDMGLLPQPAAVVGFGTAFALGWFVHRESGVLDAWRRQWAMNLAIGAALSALSLWIVGPTPPADVTAVVGPAWYRGVYAIACIAAIWYWAFGLLGAALRFCAGENRLRRYLADASYWIYLVHLPIVFGLQVLVMDWPLHWSVKFPAIVAVTLLVSLASYRWLVRSTVLGELLNGRRMPRRVGPHDADAIATTDTTQPGSNAPVAELHHVVKRYGSNTVLDGLNLAVQRGELLALLGPNGAGKTTAIGLWLGTLAPDAGHARLFGGVPGDVHSRLGLGVMLQDVSLAPMLDAREHIALAASCYRDPLRVEETIALTGIEAFSRVRYGKLSGGQKRQVQFALAVCGQPTLLFLDEPTVGLDVRAREALWRALRSLLDRGCAIVLTTHYLEEAEALANRVAVLANGALIADGSVADMRALVTRKHIRCACTVDVDDLRRWPGVVDASRDARGVQITASDAEGVVHRLFLADPHLRQLEVRQASLADALATLTQAAA